MSDYVIIGNGAAGRRAAETFRKNNTSARVLIITDEPCPFYPRPRLTTGFLSGEVERDALFMKPDFYSRNAVSIIFGKVVSIEDAENMLTLSNGGRIPYTSLLIATGASPTMPPWPGSNLDGVVTLRTLADTDAIIERAAAGGNAIVAGGGILGVEIAEGLQKRGMHASLLIRKGRDSVGAPALPAEKREARCASMEKLGVKILIQEEIAELIADEFGKLSEVVTSAGTRIQTTLAVAAIGVRPNIGFLKGSSVATGKGILVDENLRSSVPNIYAAGDAAEPSGEAAGQHCGIAPYMNAINQGEFAARKILEI